MSDSAVPIPASVPGVFLFPEAYEQVIAGLRRAIHALTAQEEPIRLRFPPVISRAVIERTGYPASFPHLLGSVHTFAGDARRWAALSPLVADGGAWLADHGASDLVLLPAACYPVYPTLAGRELTAPVTHLVEGDCYRHEATSEAGRMRTFRMRELVTAGTAEHCEAWRDRWLERLADWLASLELKVVVEPADDPFFGSGRRLYQAAQRAQRLKFELKAAVADDLVQAVTSANWHKDHFGAAFGFTAEGEPAHTACLGFGLERLALALIHAHGPVPARWPAPVVGALG